jgi:transposase
VDAKKKTLGATERDPVARAAWENDRAPTLDPRRIFAVDEMATSIALTRLYGYAPADERCVGSIPKNHGQPTSLVAALSLQGLEAAMTRLGAIDTLAFEAFIDHVLGPLLQPDDWVLLDNLSAHKALSVRAKIEARGAHALFLPAYSPDFNPIELAFSKVKQVLRSAAARTQEALEAAIADALDAITPEDALAYFRHCNITVPSGS